MYKYALTCIDMCHRRCLHYCHYHRYRACRCSLSEPPNAFSGRALREYRLWTLKRGFVNLRVHTSHSQKTTLLRYVSSLEGSRHPQALMSKRADPETGGRAG